MKTPNESPKLPNDDSQSAVKDGRRRFVGAGTAAGVVLAVTGRSAMATGSSTSTGKCLSPLAWVSLYPEAGGVPAKLSHTVTQTCTFGKSPGYWLPNCGGTAKTFQGSWPTALGVNPFSPSILGKNNRGYDVTYNLSNYLQAKGVSSTDSGWAGGSTISFYRPGTSISRLLLDSAASGVERHICAAYLNIKSYPGYPVTLEELEKLATGQKIGGRVFSSSEVKAYLDQTWT